MERISPVRDGCLAGREALSVPEAAFVLGIGRTLAYELAKTGDIPTVRLGGRIIVPRARLDDLLRRSAEQSDDGKTEEVMPGLR